MTETCLNDLHVRLLETADLYGLLADRSTEPALADLFADLALRRSAAAESTERFIRRLNGLPDVPDTDWETLEQWFTEAQQALDPQHRASVARALEHEAQLTEAVEAALRQPVSGEVRRFLDELHLGIQNARKRLNQQDPGERSPQ